MAQNITVVIGARKAGKSHVADIAQLFFTDCKRITPDTQLMWDFIQLNDMSLEDFYERLHYEEHRNLLLLFREVQHQKHPDKYTHHFLNELQSCDNVVIDNVYYFKDLAVLIEHQAKILFIDTPMIKRQEFGYRDGMDRKFYTQEVAAITVHDVAKWANTTIIQNNGSSHDLKVQLRNLI